MKLGVWLMGMMQPLIGRILASLGFSVVNIVGLGAIIDQVRGQMVANINSLPVDMLNLFLYCGGGIGFGVILGALSTKLMLWQITSSTRILGANPG